MSDETVKVLLDKALRRRRELQFELETVQRLIDGYRRLQLLQDENPYAEQLHLWHGPSRRAMKAEELAALLEEARRIILREGRPLTRSELVDHLERLGYRVPGADRKKALGTNLWRSGKFIQVEGKGYWPNDTGLPEGLV